MYELPDPLAGWIEPLPVGRCTRPACECESDTGPLCWVCEAEWAAMLSDADIHPCDDLPADEDPWLAEQREPLDEDDEVWARFEALEESVDA